MLCPHRGDRAELGRHCNRVTQPGGDLLLRVSVGQLERKMLLIFIHHIGYIGNIPLTQLRRKLVINSFLVIPLILQ